MKQGYSFELSSLKGANTRFSTGTGPRLGFLVIQIMMMRHTKYQYKIQIQEKSKSRQHTLLHRNWAKARFPGHTDDDDEATKYKIQIQNHRQNKEEIKKPPTHAFPQKLSER